MKSVTLGVTLGFVALGLFLLSGCGQSADSGQNTRPDWAVGQGEKPAKESRDRLARNPRGGHESSARDGRYEESKDRESDDRYGASRRSNASGDDSERSASRDQWRARRADRRDRDLDKPVPPDDEAIAREEASERRRRERDRETEVEADRYYTRQASQVVAEPSTAPPTENRIASDEEESEDEE